jgi:hypothetical protein
VSRGRARGQRCDSARRGDMKAFAEGPQRWGSRRALIVSAIVPLTAEMGAGTTKRDVNAALDERREALHDLGYPNADATEGLKDGPTGTWPFMAKRYSESDIALHVHV